MGIQGKQIKLPRRRNNWASDFSKKHLKLGYRGGLSQIFKELSTKTSQKESMA